MTKDIFMTHKNGKLKLVLLAAVCCLLWGTAIPTLKTLYTQMAIPSTDMYSKLVLAGIRFLMAGTLIGVFVLMRDKRIMVLKGKQWRDALIFGLLNTTLQYMFFYVGVGNTGAIKGVLIDTSKPMMVVVMAHLFIKDDRITRNKILGLLVGTIGIIVANIDKISTGGIEASLSFTGEGFLIISSLAYSAAVIFGKHVMKVIPSTILNMYQMILGAIILLVMGLIGTGGYHLHFTPLAVILLVYSAFLSAIAFVLWYSLINQYSASSVSVYAFLVPVFGSIFSSILFPEEHLSLLVLASLVLMSIGIWLVNRVKQSA